MTVNSQQKPKLFEDTYPYPTNKISPESGRPTTGGLKIQSQDRLASMLKKEGIETSHGKEYHSVPWLFGLETVRIGRC